MSDDDPTWADVPTRVEHLVADVLEKYEDAPLDWAAERVADLLTEKGLLPDCEEQWAWLTPTGALIITGFAREGGEIDARNAVATQGGKVRARTVYTAPKPTKWTDVE